jgi:hypothetical protein
LQIRKKYLYVLFNWGGEPAIYRSKKAVVNHIGKSNSRIVDSWFEENWFVFINNHFILRIEIPKMKSKIRK